MLAPSLQHHFRVRCVRAQLWEMAFTKQPVTMRSTSSAEPLRMSRNNYFASCNRGAPAQLLQHNHVRHSKLLDPRPLACDLGLAQGLLYALVDLVVFHNRAVH